MRPFGTRENPAFFRYWMAGGESEKTSLRVKAAHTQMTEDGVWRGGKVPYGYRLVHNGRIGKKNRQLYDLEVDPEHGKESGLHRAAAHERDCF